ncbi:MAG: inositol monophosphatase family protein [Candidatus Helarchaeota archaeon]
MILIKDLKNAVKKVKINIQPLIGTSFLLGKKGAGGDDLEQIDIIAEETVIKYLKSKGHSFNLISEEIGEIQIGNSPEHYIILDPIDGSTNASRGLPYFCVSIATASSNKLGDLFYGIVMDLTSGNLFEAIKDRGASLNETKISVSNISELKEAVISTNISIQNLEKQFSSFINLGRKVRKIRVFGSSALDLCHVAAGNLDAFIDLRKKLRIVDLAAGKIIVEEAGGTVYTEDGKTLNDLDLSISTRTTICASNLPLKPKILKNLTSSH